MTWRRDSFSRFPPCLTERNEGSGGVGACARHTWPLPPQAFVVPPQHGMEVPAYPYHLALDETAAFSGVFPLFAGIAAADQDDDWKDPETWAKAIRTWAYR